MKKINLIEWLSRNSHEKQKPQRFARYAAMLIMLLTLGVGQMWASMGFENSNNGVKFTRTPLGGASGTWNESHGRTRDDVDLGNVTALTLKEWYCKFYQNEDNMCGEAEFYYRVYLKDGTPGGFTKVSKSYFNWNSWSGDWRYPTAGNNNINSGSGTNILSGLGSGIYYFEYYFQNLVKGKNGDYSSCNLTIYCANDSKNFKDKFTIKPNALTSFSVSRSGYSAGTGTSDDPYIIARGGSLTLTASGSGGTSDANSTIKYKYGSSGWQTTSYTISDITSTTKTSITVKGARRHNSQDLGSDESSVTIYYKAETTYSVSISSGSPSSVLAGANYTTPTITASNVTGYHFDHWSISGNANVASTTTSPTTVTATSTGATITANYEPNTYTITLDDNGSYQGDGSATATYDNGTLTDFSHASRTGWSPSGYYTGASDGTMVIDAGGNLVASVAGYTDASGNWTRAADTKLYARWVQAYAVLYNANGGTGTTTDASSPYAPGADVTVLGNSFTRTGYTFTGWNTAYDGSGDPYAAGATIENIDANVTLYAQWSENMTTVTVNVSPAGWGTLTVGGASFTPGNTTTAGVTTSRTVVATAANSDFSFNTWGTTGNATGTSSTNTYTLKGNGSAGTGTLTANFVENVASGWYLGGSNPLGNDWGTTNTSYPLNKKYRGMTGVFYRYVASISTDGFYTVHNGTTRYRPSTGNNATFGGAGWSNKVYMSNTTASANVKFNANGNYYICVDTRGTYPYIWYETSEPERRNYHTVNVTGAENEKGAVKVTLGSTTGFETTKFANGETFYISVTPVTGWIPSIKIGSADAVTWWKEGTYTASGTMSTSDVTVTISYSPTRAVTFAKTTGCSTLSATGPSSTAVTTGTKVKDGTVIRFAQTASTGYTFSKWYSNNTGTSGTEYSTSSSAYDLTISSTSYTIYPLYTENSYATNVVISPTSTGSISSPTPSDGKINVSHHTGTSVTASPADHYAFVNWAVSSGGLTMASSNTTNPNTFNATSAGGTITANFALQWALKGGDSSQGSPDAMGDWGTYNGMTYTGTANTYRVSISLAARTTYDFKIVNRRNGNMYGKNSGNSFTRGGTTSASGCSTGAGSTYNLHVTTDAAGSYTFTYNTSSNTITVGFPEAYTITFDKGTGGSTITATASASGTLNSGNYVASGEDVTFTQTANTGYTFAGWYDAASGGSAVSGMGVSDPVLENVTANKTVYSRYTAHTYQVRFNKNDVGASGTMSNQSFTYDEASKALTSNAFYKDGYSFDYWTTASDGTGTQYTNGQSVRNLSSTNNDVIDLYAHWTEVTITDLTFEPASAAGSTTVTVTPVLSGTPTGTSSICWGLYYDALCTREVPGIEFSANPSAGAASVTFTSPAASGSYYVKATYRTGSACNAGTVLGEPRIEQYVVASKHDLTVKYMCGSTEITSRRLVEIPAASYTLVAPADVFGYTFSSWSAGDGVTITDPTDAEKEEAGLDGVANVKKVTATYDGILTANYSKKSMILFKNTLNWNKVYVNVYTASKWGVKGAGNQDPNVTVRNQEMSLVPGTTDIYYYECSPTAAYVAFTDRSQDNYEFFSAGTSNPVKVSYPTKPDASGSEDTNYGFNAGTPMFVPLSGQTAQKWNNPGDGDHAAYSNKGYWRKYEPATGKTGYTLEIYNKTNDSSRDTVYTIPMVESTSEGDIFEATVILEANKTGDSKYGVKFRRDNGMRYTKTSGSFAKDGSYSVFTKGNDNYAAYGMETTVAGEYTFRIACANDGTLKMAVKYPASAGDYRLVYTDDVHSLAHPSEIVRKEANGTDIVSFFVRKAQSPSIRMQSCAVDGSGNVSWSNYGAAISPATTYSSVITEDGVYDFHLAMDEDGALSISKVEPYTGDFYIRTDAVGGTKWADFRNEAHRMTYSDYAAANKGFTHYYVNWVTQNSNVKFTVANDYSPCISDTLVADPTGNVVASIDGDGKMTSANANIRYMYNVKDNTIKRAYIAGAQDNSSYFLVLQGQNGYITDPSGNRLMSANGNNYGVDNDATQLADNNEWLYKISVKATPGGKVKLYARYNTVDQYFIGKAAVDDWSTPGAYEVLISGDGGAQNISVVYDYKTDRMIAAWEPADEINSEMTLDADILIVREHQEPANNITFGDAAYSLTTDKTVYGVMRFYRNTLDNRDGDGNILPVADQLSQRERYHYYISFPFDVNVSDIFGFGSYGVHWVLQYYDGKARAKNGLWADPGMTYWKYVPPTGKLNANEGYLLALSPSKMAYSNTADGQVWAKGKTVVELYFPDATMGATIGDGNVTIPAPSSDYQCTIWRGKETGEHEGDRNYDRRIADSYWRCIGVPSFKDFDDDLTDGTSAYAWVDPAAYTTGDIHFLYEIQWTDYSLRAVSADNFAFKAMHAYLVQNSTAIVWNHVNAISHSPVVVRRRNAAEIDNVEFRLELQKNNELVDQTFVRLSDDEAVTAGFEFNHDMSKELYSTKANIYTFIGLEPVAANSLPISTQTTIVPVGLKLATDGDYTFSIPEGTEGIGVTLIDNETGIRTSLSTLDYTINLNAGTYDNRFVLEISPIKETPTGIEQSPMTNDQSQIKKVMIDGILYIVKDGKMYDARGSRVQ